MSLPKKGLGKKQDKSTRINQQQPRLSKKTAGKRKQKMNKIEQDTDSSDDVETVCIVCMEHFNNTKPKEDWVQWMTCSLWVKTVISLMISLHSY